MAHQKDLLEHTRETDPLHPNFNNSRRFPSFPVGLIENASEYGYVTDFDDVEFQRRVQVDQVWIKNHEVLTKRQVDEFNSQVDEMKEEINTKRRRSRND